MCFVMQTNTLINPMTGKNQTVGPLNLSFQYLYTVNAMGLRACRLSEFSKEWTH